MADRVSRKQLATIWDVSTRRIDALVNEGRLVETDGTIDREQAEQVRASFAPAKVQKEISAKEAGGQRSAQQDPKHPLVQARTIREVYQAKSVELSFKLRAGEVVLKADVQAEAFELFRVLQQTALAWPARLSAVIATNCAGLPPNKVEPAVRKILTKEVRDMLTNLGVGLKDKFGVDQKADKAEEFSQ